MVACETRRYVTANAKSLSSFSFDISVVDHVSTVSLPPRSVPLFPARVSNGERPDAEQGLADVGAPGSTLCCSQVRKTQ